MATPYSRFQRTVSALLIFSVLFSQTVELPLIDRIQAEEATNVEVVSFIVEEGIFSGDIATKIQRYAEDIQANRPGTRVDIFPVAKTAHPFLVASINEKLYYEGDGRGLSRLVGTVLIGQVPLPVMHSGEKTFLSIYPYVDFDEKVFVFNHANGYYEKSTTIPNDPKPEIWHGVIAPNTGDATKDEQELKDFFDKDHEYYQKTGAFAQKETPPYVFLFDALHDQESVSAEDWQSYKNRLAHNEDIAYRRFSKDLAQSLYSSYTGLMQRNIESSAAATSSKEIQDALAQYGSGSLSLDNAPDVQTQEIVNKSAKQFFEIFSSRYIGDQFKFVQNAGRYGLGKEVRADITPAIIAKEDVFTQETLKSGNTAVEDAIDAFLNGGVARKIPVLLHVSLSGTGANTAAGGTIVGTGGMVYANYAMGIRADYITSPSQCSIVRWSSQAVEANRAFNTNTAQSDAQTLQNDLWAGACFAGGHASTNAFWGGNSILNLDTNNVASGDILKLKSHVYHGFSRPIFDITGSKKLTSNSPLTVNSPLDCLQNDLLLQPYSYTVVQNAGEYTMNETRYWPEEKGSALAFSCNTEHKSALVGTFEQFAEGTGSILVQTQGGGNGLIDGNNAAQNGNMGGNGNDGIPSCVMRTVEIDGHEFRTDGTTCATQPGDGIVSEDMTLYQNIAYKTIPSVLTHKSPTNGEFGLISQAMATPSLPIDANRYVDFLGAAGNYRKVEYPNFFRIRLAPDVPHTYTEADKQVKALLDAKTQELNAILNADRASATGAVYNALKSGTYPAHAPDLYALLKSNADTYKMVVQSVLWNNLNNATAKYAWVLGNALNTGENVSPMPGHRNDYEIASLQAPGDAEGMHIKLDPDAKVDLDPTLSLIAQKNRVLLNTNDAINIASTDASKNKYQCGPPEGVPLWEWLPAIFCWLGTLLPPKISAGSCSQTSLLDLFSGNKDDADYFKGSAWNTDNNDNGLADVYEAIKDGELRLTPDSSFLSYRTQGRLVAQMMRDGHVIVPDSLNQVDFSVEKITHYASGSSVGRVVFNANSDDEALNNADLVSQYIGLSKKESIRVQQGVARLDFSVKSEDIDVVIRAGVTVRNTYQKAIFTKRSDPITLRVRGDRLAITALVREEGETDFSPSASIAAGNPYGMAFNLARLNKAETAIPSVYPYSVRVVDDITGREIVPTVAIRSDRYVMQDPRVLNLAGVYRLEVTDGDGVRATRSFSVLPANVNQIDVQPATNTFVTGEHIPILVRLLDRFGNVVSGDALRIQMRVDNGVFLVASGSTATGSTITTETNATEKVTIEGYANFTLTAHAPSDTVNIHVSLASPTLEAPITTLKAITYARAEVQVDASGSVVVGGAAHAVRLRIADADGNTIPGFRGVAALNFPELSGELSNAYVPIDNGETASGALFLTPKFAAGKNLELAVQVPGVTEIRGNRITVLPEAPVRVGLSADQTSFEAKTTEGTTVRASLYDRYGNVVWNHDPSAKIEFSVPTTSASYLRMNDGTMTGSVSVSEGNAAIRVRATTLPGTPYIVAKTTPALETNSFTLTSETGATLSLSGVSENVMALDTFYKYNREKIEGTNPNALYTVLLGSNYADVTHANSLGDALLFQRTGRTLGITGLLNDVTKRDTAFSFTPAGQYRRSGSDANIGLVESIVSQDRKTFLQLYDSYKKETIARAWWNFAPDTPILSCATGSGSLGDISGCPLASPTPTSFILMRPASGFAVETSSGGTVMDLKAGTNTLFSIDTTGNIINRNPAISLSIDTTQTLNLLGVRITANNRDVGYLALRFLGTNMLVQPSSAFPAILAASQGRLVVESVSSRYLAQPQYLGVASSGARGVRFVATEGTSTAIDTDLMGNVNVAGIENSAKTKGIGWGEGGNRMMLEFSAGASMGEATRFYHTYSLINLGDPVIHIDPVKDGPGSFDKTIGERIVEAGGDSIDSYKLIDFNGDGLEDFVVFTTDGRVRLVANYNGSFKDMGYLAYVSDAGAGRKGVGAFRGDKFGGIAMSTRKWALVVIENRKGKFVRTAPTIVTETGATTQMRGVITQLEVFDMDQDGKADIVTVDDSGELNILYATLRADDTLVFTKKLIDASFAVKLDTGIKKEGGAVWYAGMRQPPDLEGQDLYNEESDLMQWMTGTGSNLTSLPPSVQTHIVDKQLFFQYDFPLAATTGTGNAASGAIFEPISEAEVAKSVGLNESGQPNTALTSEVMNGIQTLQSLGASGTVRTTALAARTERRSFIRSEFADGLGVKVEKTYTDANGVPLQGGDIVKTVIRLTNLDSTAKTDLTYLDSYNKKLFRQAEDAKFTMFSAEHPDGVPLQISDLVDTPFDFSIEHLSIPAHGSIEIRSELAALPVSAGKIYVGKLEPTSAYGEIAISPSNQCGSDMVAWRAIAPYPRTYQRGTITFSDNSPLPEDVKKNTIDENNNGIPDYIDTLQGATAQGDYTAMQQYASGALADYNKDLNSNGIPDRSETVSNPVFRYDASTGQIDMSGMGEAMSQMSNIIDFIEQGMGCGFGGGSCLGLPLNWAPLAPGSAPVIFGFPLGPLIPETGYPIFSAMTGVPVPTPTGPICVPTVWPMSPLGLIPGPGVCGAPSAGGYLGTWNPLNEFRLFITPTLTMAVGTALCFGGPAAIKGRIPPPGVSPVAPGGNCVVAAMPLWNCKNDGSDGDPRTRYITHHNTYINANSCSTTGTLPPITTTDVEAITEYVRNPSKRNDTNFLSGILDSIQKVLGSFGGGGTGRSDGAFINIGGAADGDADFEVSLDFSSLEDFDFSNFDIGNIVKISNMRVAGFPEFLMDWVARQLEEVLNKITTLPTLYIILPDLVAVENGSSIGFSDKFKEALNQVWSIGSNVTNAFNSGVSSEESLQRAAQDKRNAQNTKLAEDAAAGNAQEKDWLDDASDTLHSVGDKARSAFNGVNRNLSGIKAAYEFLSHLPLINIHTEEIALDIPWASAEEFDKWAANARLTYEQWKEEIGRYKRVLDRLESADGRASIVDEGFNLASDALMASLQENIDIINEYINFPEKIQKYLEFKERYAEQILCNIRAIDAILGGWLRDNGIRFRKWVELYVLIKAILKSWQLIIDIFTIFDAECGVCRNERWDMKHFLFKLISMVIPKIPVIQFPKWPDIILDAHNIRVNLDIPLPYLDLNLVPLVLPQLPQLHLPSVRGQLTLPAIPRLPRLPRLPDLPDIPSLPLIELPNLPPPPKIPALFGALAAILDILKLVARVLCLMRKLPLVPEWRAGDQIAQITERQGTFPLDFIDLQFPNLSLAFVDAIKVTSYVNFEFSLDFIIQMAQSALEPFNSFTANLTNITNIELPINTDFSHIVPTDIHIDADTFRDRDSGYNSGTGTTKKDILSEAPAADRKRIEGKIALLEELSRRIVVSSAGGFVHLVRYIQANASQEQDLDAFKATLKENLDAIAMSKNGLKDKNVRGIHETLSRAVAYKAEDQQAFIDSLRRAQEDKLQAVTDYVEADLHATRALKAELTRLLKEKRPFGEFSPIASQKPQFLKINSISSELKTARETLRTKLEVANEAILPSLKHIKEGRGDTEVTDIKQEGQAVLKNTRDLLKVDAKDTINDISFTTQNGATVVPTSAFGMGDTVAKFGNASAVSSSTTTSGTSNSAIFTNTSSDISALTSTNPSTVLEAKTTPSHVELAATGTIVGNGTRSPLASSYTYKYEGIYIKTSSDTMTRLFNYLDEVDGKEEVLEADFDRDGSNDVLYRMGDGIYMKRNLDTPSKRSHISDTPRTFNAENFLGIATGTTPVKTAPNFFREIFASSNRIGFSFNPANPQKDKLFRLEFFDTIGRFDRIDAGENPRTIVPWSAGRVVDLLPEPGSEITVSNATGALIQKQSVYLTLGRGDADVHMRTWQTLTGSARASISAMKPIYTDAGGATISYLSATAASGAVATRLTLPANTSVTFGALMDVTVESGNLILFGASETDSRMPLENLNGMPILPDTKISLVSPAATMTLGYASGDTHTLDNREAYELYDLGEVSTEYTARLSIPEDWYYARLAAVDQDGVGTWAGLTLFSPQLASDTEAPLINLGNAIRIPVYQQKAIDFSTSITDISGLSRLVFDGDTRIDSNGNGNPADDYDSETPGNPYKIMPAGGTGVTNMVFGPYDSLFKKPMRVFVWDRAGNQATRDVILDVYAPVPQISLADTGSVVGSISEALSNEPVDIIRDRGGTLQRIGTMSGGTVRGGLTTSTGWFVTQLRQGTGVTLESGTGTSRRILGVMNEKTGKITLLDSTLRLVAESATADSKMRITIRDAAGVSLFGQRFFLPPEIPLQAVDTLDGLSQEGVYVHITDGSVSAIPSPSDAPTIPGGIYITTNADHVAQAAVSPTGDIVLLNSAWRIGVESRGDYTLLRITNAEGTSMAEVWYRFEREYVVE